MSMTRLLTVRSRGATDSTRTSGAAAPSRRWWLLAVLGVAQLMVVLDATIITIALPSAQRALGFSNADRQWVLTAYTLAFGGFLLVGGRLSDIFGRKRTFLVGLVGFVIASSQRGSYNSVEGALKSTFSSDEKAKKDAWETGRWVFLGVGVVGLVLTVLPGKK